MVVTALGVAAASWGVIMGISPVLQIRRIIRRRSSDDVSISYFGVLLTGFFLWLAYGIAIGDLVLIIPNSVAICVAIATILVARRYR
ncbi:MAG: SemiSWEET family transporter [Actinomycetota bacterium]